MTGVPVDRAAARRTASWSIVPAFDHGVGAHRAGAAGEPEVLALVGVEELLPQPRGGRVRRVRVDRLEVVAGDDGVLGHDDLPAVDLRRLGGVEVVPVDDDRRLAGLDRRRGRVDRQEVAGVLELARRSRRPGSMSSAEPPLATEAITTPLKAAPACGRVAVERDLALEVRAEQVVERWSRRAPWWSRSRSTCSRRSR